MFGRFLLGAGLGGLVGTGVLALVSVTFSGPFPLQTGSDPARPAGTVNEDPGAPGSVPAEPVGPDESISGEAVSGEAVSGEVGAGEAGSGENPAGNALPPDAGLAAPVLADPEMTDPEMTDPAMADPAPQEESSSADPAANSSTSREAAEEPEPEALISPQTSPAEDIAAGSSSDRPDEAAGSADPDLGAALDAAFEAGADAEQPDIAESTAPENMAAEDRAPEAVVSLPDAEGLPAMSADTEAPAAQTLPEGIVPEAGADQPGTSLTAARPTGPGEDRAPASVPSPDAPPPLVEDMPSVNVPAQIREDEFVILDELPPPPEPAAPEEIIAPGLVEEPVRETQVGAAPELPADMTPDILADAGAEPAPGALTMDGPPDVPVEPPAGEGGLVPDAAADAVPAPEVSVPQPEAPPSDDPARILALDDNSTLPGSIPGARNAGVETGRLPRIGDSPAGVAPADEAVDATVALPPRVAFSRPFDNPSGKPRFAVILIDDGASDIDRAALAALPFPVSFAIDAQLPDAAAISALYRAAGQEVIMLTSGLPRASVASDIAVAFDAMGRALPEAVAAMDVPGRGFQGDRPLSTLVVPQIGSQGLGLVTWNVGLNAADQVARREDVPSAVVFRDLDAGGEEAPVIRRYLDRAAFKAAQDGGVTVVGRAGHAPTVAALLQWAVEGRAASVELAPLTAMLSID